MFEKFKENDEVKIYYFKSPFPTVKVYKNTLNHLF